MGTKNDPGKFDCYANAEPDEPMFILLGRDPAAAATVAFWTTLRTALDEDGSDAKKIAEASAAIVALANFARGKGKAEAVRECSQIFKFLQACVKVQG